MQDFNTEQAGAGEAAVSTRSRPTLESLSRASFRDLETLYREAHAPSSLSALEGALRGRALASAGPLGHGLPFTLLRLVARSRAFPWAGKTFHARDQERGEGANRVRLFGTREWFAFSMRLAPSALDGAPCVLLDYDRADNPFFLRRIRDELREAAPGLFFGPATWRTRGTPAVLVWFAVDASRA